MKRIAIDMDEVISHFSAKCLELFNEEFQERLYRSAFAGQETRGVRC